MRALLNWLALAAVALLLVACGGGSGGGDSVASSTPAPAAPPGPTTPIPAGATAVNVLPVTLDQGLDGTALNSPFVSVTVCQPGTQSCRTIDHILVDTGSVGLRLDAAALGTVSLPPLTAPNQGSYGECAQFASGYTWGSVHTADVQLAGEQANAIPVQVYNQPASTFASAPSGCTNTGVPLAAAGSNGILGVGFQVRDCGAACTTTSLPGMYYTCNAQGCSGTTVPSASQVANPVAMLNGGDNNGIVLQLPDIPVGGVSSLGGMLTLGVGTRDNNRVVGTVYTADASGNISTTYKGTRTDSFIDSGSNAIFFADSSIPTCSSGFYCPPSPLTLSATVTGSNGNSGTVGFVIENAGALPANTAAAHLGGTLALANTFDWGLPFFFGRTVYEAFEGAATPVGPGPYWAF